MSHPLLARILVSCSLLVAWLGVLAPAQAQQLEVHVINVDQGLAVYVRSPSGTRSLIDAGNPGDGNALVKPYLQSIGVSALDSTWMTHWHTDHFGGLTDLFTSGYKPLLAAYDRGDTNKPSNSFVTQYSSAVAGKRQIASVGQIFDLGGGATLQVVAVNAAWPGGSVDPSSSSQEENSRSMAIVIRYGDFDCYVGGDCTSNGDGSTSNVEGPASAVIGQVEVAIAAHHGSTTSSSSQVVANLAPAMVVQSAGLDNPYGHPTKTVTNRWNTTSTSRVQWCTTDGDTGNGAGAFTGINGSIVLISDGASFSARRAGAAESLNFATWEQPVAPAGLTSLVISEALIDPLATTDVYGEWIELRSKDSAPISLAGLKLVSGASSFTIASPVILANGEHFLVGVDGRRSRNGNVHVDLGAPWEQFGLSNASSSLSLRTAANALIETLAWGSGGAALTPGKSLERILVELPASPSNFASALAAWFNGDFGTPRALNANDPEACPDPLPFGTGKLSSVGSLPLAGWLGSASVYSNDLHVTVSDAVPNKSCIAFYSNTAGALPFSGGTLYMAPPISRLPGQLLDATGFASWYFPLAPAHAGQRFYFQFWFRDPNAPDGTKVGLSNALDVQVCPGSFSPPTPGAGSIVITEIMKDPSFVPDASGEWIEIFNTTAQTIDIEGWTLRDDDIDAHVLDNGGSGILIPAGQYRVLGINGNPATNGGVALHYVWSNFLLANSADEVVLVDGGGLEIDRVAYLSTAPWPSTPGRALNLKSGVLDASANDDPLNWCSASSTISGTNSDRGTPNLANNSCP